MLAQSFIYAPTFVWGQQRYLLMGQLIRRWYLLHSRKPRWVCVSPHNIAKVFTTRIHTKTIQFSLLKLTLKAPIMTAIIFHENCLPADDSHELSCLICNFWKSGKIWYCRLLQTIGGARLETHKQVLLQIMKTQVCKFTQLKYIFIKLKTI